MTETEVLNLVSSALSDLREIKVDTHDIKQIIINDHVQEIELPSDDALTVNSDEVDPQLITLQDDTPINDLETDFMTMQWTQTSLLVAILVVLLLKFGVQLWQCFSDKWRS